MGILYQRPIDEKLSAELKLLISESRLVAIDLGYDFISTIHFFLADCRINDKFSIRKFGFSTDAQFEKFYNECRVAESSVLVNSLPLTVHAEQTVRKAHALRITYNDTEVRPHHLFLATCQIPKNEFFKIFPGEHDLQNKLELYYTKIGVLKPGEIKNNWWDRLKANLF